jgi:septum site-determining protein MinD
VAKIIAVHSFRGGTGKSNTVANVAVALARGGLRVGVIDTDVQSPGLHVLFGIGDESEPTLNEYLWGGCEIAAAVRDVTHVLTGPVDGRLFVLPASIRSNDITRMLRDGYSIALLHDGMRELVARLELDVLLVDTHPGLNEETLLSIATSDALLILMRPDRQDYEGTGVTVQIARRLTVPRVLLAVNNVPAGFASDDVRLRVEDRYGCEVLAVMPHVEEMMTLASGGIFSQAHPDHPLTAIYRTMARELAA